MFYLVMVEHAFNASTQKQRQVDFCEFKDSRATL